MEALEAYQKAIRLNPQKEDAYLFVLKNLFLKDDLFSLDEDKIFREILKTSDENLSSYEESLRANEKGYAKLSYELGIAYFYKYQGENGKKYAKSYFQEAAASGKLESYKQKRAQCLAVIAGYYEQIGMMDAAGDVLVSYSDYWQDLQKVSEGNLVEEDNARTALVVYKEVVGQILSRTSAFAESGITKEEMLTKLREIEKHLREDFLVLDGITKEEMTEEVIELQKYIKKAKTKVASVYEQTEQEE